MKMFKQTLKLFSLLLYFFFVPALASGLLIVEPEDGRKPIIDALQKARTSIDLAMYGFTDPELIQAFIQAKEKGKKLRILLQHFPYRNQDENRLAIQRFSENHINLAYEPEAFQLLHQKTLLIDESSALVTTFNFTRATFKKQRNFGLWIKDPAEIKEIQAIFNADWTHKKWMPKEAHLIWSPDNSREKILALIGSAKKEIIMYAQSVSDYKLVGELARAAHRGIKIQILTSSAPSKKWNYLQKAGVKIALDKKLYIHAKVMIVDKEKALLGSINFTKTSLDKNRELSVLVDDSEVITKLLAVFAKDWQSARLSS